jgi:hypothetical protein
MAVIGVSGVERPRQRHNEGYTYHKGMAQWLVVSSSVSVP